LNKSDLPAKFDEGKLSENLGKPLRTSAKFDRGIEQLITQIRNVLDVSSFDLKTPVCFTGRQENLLKQLANVKSDDRAAQIISELLNGRLPV
jgi:tRNA U34 5-carboxymethylaminomethyl modifying GTPase MnmE/TrmE